MRGIIFTIVLATAACGKGKSEAPKAHVMVTEEQVIAMSTKERQKHAGDRIAKLESLVPEMTELEKGADLINRNCIQDQSIMLKTILSSAETRQRHLGEHIVVDNKRQQVRSTREIEKLYIRGMETARDGRNCFDQPTEVFVERRK